MLLSFYVAVNVLSCKIQIKVAGLFAGILKMKSINNVMVEELQKAYEKQEEMPEDVDSTGAENEEVAMESA